jgi:hypothetical protein
VRRRPPELRKSSAAGAGGTPGQTLACPAMRESEQVRIDRQGAA